MPKRAKAGQVARETWHGPARVNKVMVALVAEFERAVEAARNGVAPNIERIMAIPQIGRTDDHASRESAFERAVAAYAVASVAFEEAFARKSRRRGEWAVGGIPVRSWHHLPIALWTAVASATASKMVRRGSERTWARPAFVADGDVPDWAVALEAIAGRWLPKLRAALAAELLEAARPAKEGLAALPMPQKAAQAAVMMRDGATVAEVCERFAVSRQTINTSKAWAAFRDLRQRMGEVRAGGTRTFSRDALPDDD